MNEPIGANLFSDSPDVVTRTAVRAPCPSESPPAYLDPFSTAATEAYFAPPRTEGDAIAPRAQSDDTPCDLVALAGADA